MSEVYKFKAMSQVEALDAPAGGTTILAVDNGVVKQIPAAKLGSSGSGSGGGYRISGVLDEATYGVVDVDRSYEEIAEAVMGGAAPHLFLQTPDGEESTISYIFPMVGFADGLMIFQVVFGGGVLEVTCTSDDEWSFGLAGGD